MPATKVNGVVTAQASLFGLWLPQTHSHPRKQLPAATGNLICLRPVAVRAQQPQFLRIQAVHLH